MHQSTPFTPPKPRRWWLYVLLAPPALVFFLVLAAIILLRTDFGLQRAERLLNSTLVDVGGHQIALSGLHGRFPFDLRLAELRLADHQGPWLKLNDLALRWSGWDVLAGRLRIHELSASRLELQRTPAADPDAPAPKPEPKVTFPVIKPPAFLPQIVLERFALSTIILGEAVVGERMELGLHGDLDTGIAGTRINVTMDSLSGPAGAGGMLRLHAGFVLQTNLLTLHAEFADPRGALAPLLGLPKATPLELLLVGSGPPTSWNGTFTVQAGELIALDSELILEWQNVPSLNWHGKFAIAPALLPEPADAYLSATAFQIQATRPDPQNIHLAEVALRNPRLHAVLNADLDLSRSSLRGALRLDVLDTVPLSAFAGVDLGPAIRLQGAVDGLFSDPNIRLALNLTDIAADPARIADLDLDVVIRFTGKTSGSGQIISAVGAMNARGLYVPDTALPAELTARFDMDYHQADKFLDLKSLTLVGQEVDLRASAGYSLDDNQLNAQIELRPTPIQPWLALYGLEDVVGEANFQITAQGTVQPLDLELDLTVDLDQLAGLPAPLPGLLGKAPGLHAQVRLLPDADGFGPGPGLIQARTVRLHAHGLHLNATAAFVPATKELTAQAILELPNLALASPNPDVRLTGAAVLDVQARGDVTRDLSVHLNLHSANLRVADMDAFPLKLLVRAHSLPDAPHGELFLSASPRQTDLALETAFALNENMLRLFELNLIVPEGALFGQGEVDLETQLVTAQLRGRIEDIGHLSTLAGQNIHGALDMDLDLRPDGQAQDARISAALSDLRAADFGTMTNLHLNGRIQDVLGAVDGLRMNFDIAAQGFQANAIEVRSLDANVTGSLSDIALRVATQGTFLHPFTLRARAAYTLQDAVRTVHVQNLTGDWAEQNLLLTDPVTITQDEGGLILSPLRLELGQALVRADARIGKQDADLRLGVENLPLVLFTPDVRGVVTAGAVLHGPKSALQGDLTLLGHGLSPTDTGLETVPTLDVQADLVLDGAIVTVVADLRETNKAAPLLQAQGRAPMTLSLDPVGLDLPRNAPVTASLQGDLDLHWLGEIVLPDSQLLVGTIGLDVHLAGTLEAPQPAGRIWIRQAGYQHLLHGVLIQDLEAEALVTAQRFDLRSLTATDGGQGRLRIFGGAELDPEQHFPLRFTVYMDNMNLLDSPMIQARLARADLNVSGSAKAQEISGQATLDRVEVFLKDAGGPRVVDLPVVETNGPQAAPPRQPAKWAPASLLALDVDVRFPAQVFVHGRGLDSEWGGNLHVSGTAAQPTLQGDIRPVRGQLDMLGKRFNLSPKSIIQFVGAHPPMPLINIQADQIAANYTFTLVVSGTPTDIAFSLHSDPFLPEDEILSQMLFGRSLSNITPVQAVRLALAVRELAGHGAGTDILGTARDILLLDELDFVFLEGGNMSLRAGKYVHERVYLRLDSDLSTAKETVSADVELAPRISLKSTVGPRGGGLGLFWKHDY